ncbi:MAG: hypothetical protein C0506_06265 [Anaerolinea sp.]|nr:hypothetical protein [Anaerolinea sp.]
MQTRFGHIEFIYKVGNLPFYRDLFTFLGWGTLIDGDGFLGLGDPNGGSFWFIPAETNAVNNRDALGVNHVAISAPSIADVDATVAYLRDRGVAALFETPRHRPEFSQGDDTYYQVMFESPDRVLFEVVYTGPK